MSIDQKYLDLKRECTREEVALNWETTPDAPLLDLQEYPSRAQVDARAHTVRTTLTRQGGGDWEVTHVSLRGMYVIDGQDSGLTFWHDYGDGHGHDLADLPGWIRSVIDTEIERRSA